MPSFPCVIWPKVVFSDQNQGKSDNMLEPSINHRGLSYLANGRKGDLSLLSLCS